MEEPFASLPDTAREKLEEKEQPEWMEPMLATLTHEPFSDPHWFYGFGALLLGYYDGDKLRYAGKVGTGFDDETLRNLHDHLSSLERKSPPYADQEDLPEDGVHWVPPKLVAEIGFEEWTKHNKLRHPRYLGLRRDKPAEDVVKEA